MRRLIYIDNPECGDHGSSLRCCRENWNAYNRWYRKENGDRIREQQRGKRVGNPKVLKQKRDSYRRNRDHHIQTVTDWRSRNNDKVREYRRNTNHRRRSQTKETDITAKWLQDLLEATDQCAVCGDTFAKSASRDHPLCPNLDHIKPLNTGGTHTRDNVRFICRTCNQTRPHDGSDVLCAA